MLKNNKNKNQENKITIIKTTNTDRGHFTADEGTGRVCALPRNVGQLCSVVYAPKTIAIEKRFGLEFGINCVSRVFTRLRRRTHNKGDRREISARENCLKIPGARIDARQLSTRKS